VQKILLVCLGNICRSPVGEGISLHLIREYHLEQRFWVDSAGTAGYHIDESPDPRTIANAHKNGVDLSALRARQIKPEDLDYFDNIYVMDRSNYNDVVAMTKTKEQVRKVEFLLNLIEPGKNLPVPDPYYGQEKDFENVFQLVNSACRKMLSLPVAGDERQHIKPI
jgi:protein-tyrosine phosphatase